MAEATKWDTIAPRQRSGKPPRPRDQRRLRNNFLIARPPLLAVMQGGGSPYSNFFTASMTADWRLAILMGQLARHVGGCYKCRYFFANICLHRSVILVLHLLMAAPYRACIRSAHVLMAAPYRACIRSAHVLMAAPYWACIRSAAGTASSAISKMANLQRPVAKGESRRRRQGGAHTRPHDSYLRSEL